ncbi:hypothetical protein ACFQ9U_18990 [Streptomyces sp. NPDC056568]|uniref:hypothetical protein n=1 Tax=Streptomyces sp. NPDC056568 TaxID=3345866 RepID=UPI0036838C5C
MNVEPFEGAELHLHVTGSISAAPVPRWIHWLRQTHTELTVNVSVTRSAERFVSVRALRHIADGRVWTDFWDDPELPGEVNSGECGASECFLVFPATLDASCGWPRAARTRPRCSCSRSRAGPS